MPDISRDFPADRTAVITGAGGPSGIGWAAARQLAADGWSVAAVDLPSSQVRRLAEELTADGTRALALEVDVTAESEVEAAFSRIDRELPPVIGLVNLAGIACPQPLLTVSVEDFRRTMEVNVTGSFLMLRAAARRMVAAGVGRIVNTSSITALDGGGTFSKGPYAAAKAGVLGLTRGGARELGDSGVTVNTVMPGPVDTEIMGGPLTDDRRAAMASAIPVGRIGTTGDIVAAIGFLLSEQSGFINGATIQVDGGKYMH